MKRILFVAIAVRLVLLLVLGPQLTPDSGQYIEVAHNMVVGKGFSWMDRVTSRFGPFGGRTPMFQLQVATVERCLGLTTIQAAAAVSLCASLLTIQVAGPKLGWFLALSPIALEMSTSVMTDSLFTYIALVALVAGVAALKQRSAMRASVWGFFIAMATLTRTVAKLYWIVAIALLLVRFRRKAAGPVAAFLVTYALFLAPWIVRNYAQFGVVGLACGDGKNLLNSTIRLVKELPPSLYQGDPAMDLVRSAFYLEPNIFRAEDTARRITGLSPWQVDGYCQRLGLDTMVYRPGAWCRWMLKSFVNFLTSPSAELDLFGGGKLTNWATRAVLAVLFGILAPIGAVRMLRSPETFWPGVLFLVTFAYYALPSCILCGYDRFRLPVEPILFWWVIVALKQQTPGFPGA